MSIPAQPEKPLLELLKGQVGRGQKIQARVPISIGDYGLWVASIRHNLFRIYGYDAPQIDALFPKINPQALSQSGDIRPVAELTGQRLNALIARLDNVDALAAGGGAGRVFIGHGRSPLWRELKDFLQDRLHLPWEEFNREPVAGLTTFARLETMLANAGFAFLVMTGEEERADATVHARENVVHELGLLQGRLGPKRAIILLEEGCAEFSNIIGLSQVRFPKGHISACFEELRRVLEKEGVIKQ